MSFAPAQIYFAPRVLTKAEVVFIMGLKKKRQPPDALPKGEIKMKILRKMLVAVIAVSLLAVSVVGFTACGEDKTVEKTYVCGELTDNSYGGHDSDVYQLNLMSDGTYELIHTTLIYAYSMNLGTTTVETYGTYTAGTSTDGYTSYELSEATRAIVLSYSQAGGFNITIDTETSSFPCEMPAEVQGEKNMANDASDVIAKYGAAKTVYVNDQGTTFAMTNPNA